MLVRFTQIDYDREMAFVAITDDGGGAKPRSASRATSPTRTARSCEFAIVVADDWQGRGLGRRLMAQLIDVARARGLARMVGHILATNRSMLTLASSLGFTVGESPDDPTVRRATLTL